MTTCGGGIADDDDKEATLGAFWYMVEDSEGAAPVTVLEDPTDGTVVGGGMARGAVVDIVRGAPEGTEVGTLVAYDEGGEDDAVLGSTPYGAGAG